MLELLSLRVDTTVVAALVSSVQGSLSGPFTETPVGEKLKYHPFWGSLLFYKAPPRQFQPPKCKLTTSKIQMVEEEISVYFMDTKTADWRSPIPFWRVSIYILEGANLHFGGRNCLGGAL